MSAPRFLGGVALVILSACAQGAPISLGSAEVKQLAKTPYFFVSGEQVPSHDELGTSIGRACSFREEENEIAIVQALQSLKSDAKANGVAKIRCSILEDEGCERRVICTGTMIHVTQSSSRHTSPSEATQNDGVAEPIKEARRTSDSGSEIATRAEIWANHFNDAITKARAGKIKPLIGVAHSLRKKYYELFPEENGNLYIQEYFAYLVVLAERVDLKKITFAEAEYALAQKQREWAESSATARRREDERKATERQELARETARRQHDQEVLQQAQRQAEAASRQATSAAALDAGLAILQMNQNRAMMNYLNRPSVCNWVSTGRGYTQICQ